MVALCSLSGAGSLFQLLFIYENLNLALSTGDVTVRLADGSTKYEGRVEYSWYGIWGTICDRQWTFKSAAVVCRQLGFGGVETIYLRAHFGEGYGQTLGYIHCYGNESEIYYCTRRSYSHYSCPHSEDAGVRCYSDPSENHASIGATRLAGGSALQGRVEVYQNHEWTRICHDRWDILDAEVTCKQLGYPGAYTSMDASEFGLGASVNRLTDVECTGSELHVTSCRNSGWSSTNCPSYKSAAVECRSPDVLSPRLTNGSSTAEGYLEVWVGNGWDKVCKPSARKPVAEVVCKELDFEMLEDYFINIKYGNGTGKGYNIEFGCSGDEQSLTHCSNTNTQEIGWMQCDALSIRCKQDNKLSGFLIIVIIIAAVVILAIVFGTSFVAASKTKKIGSIRERQRNIPVSRECQPYTRASAPPLYEFTVRGSGDYQSNWTRESSPPSYEDVMKNWPNYGSMPMNHTLGDTSGPVTISGDYTAYPYGFQPSVYNRAFAETASNNLPHVMV